MANNTILSQFCTHCILCTRQTRAHPDLGRRGTERPKPLYDQDKWPIPLAYFDLRWRWWCGSVFLSVLKLKGTLEYDDLQPSRSLSTIACSKIPPFIGTDFCKNSTFPSLISITGWLIGDCQHARYSLVRWSSWPESNSHWAWTELCLPLHCISSGTILVHIAQFFQTDYFANKSRYHSHSRATLLDGLYGALFIR